MASSAQDQTPTESKQEASVSTKAPLYFDYNATTPLLKEVADAMVPFLYTHFGNPSSLHAFGKVTRDAVAEARTNVAKVIDATDASKEILLLSGGTESINYALKGAALAQKERGVGNHIISTAVEHVAVIETLKHLRDVHGFDVTFLPVDDEGLVSVESLQNALTEHTALLTVMLANNEVGSIMPIQELVAAAKKHNERILCHTDASQAIGKIPVSVQELGVDLLTIAGHKLYAPKGVGALYIREGTPPLPTLIHGAHHESGRRAGTENTILIAGLGKACEIAVRDGHKHRLHLLEMRDLLQRRILHHVSEKLDTVHSKNDKDKSATPTESAPKQLQLSDIVRINGPTVSRLPNTLSIGFKGLVVAKTMPDILEVVACSAGAACNDKCEPSHVLQAMGVPLEYAQGTLRLTTGVLTTKEEVEKAAKLLVDVVARHSPYLRA